MKPLELQVSTETPEVSVVVPVYFNAPTLAELYERIKAALDAAGVATWDICFVDDNSGDDSRLVLASLVQSKPNVRVLHLSRNFGSFDAITAGLGTAKGRCVAVISADLQDPPELLAEMVGHWRAGTKMVLATRNSREDPFTSRIFSYLFYRVFRATVSKEMPAGGFDFFVLDRQVARLLVDHSEKNTMIPAALLHFGFEKKLVSYHRAARQHGSSKWTFWRKFKLMYDAILSNSFVPLRIITGAGVLGLLVSLIYGAIVVIQRLLNPTIPPGWTALMVVMLFFHGLTLASLGLVGEYVWRTFDAARRRPQFVVDRVFESSALTATPPSGEVVDRGAREQEHGHPQRQ